MPFLGRQVKLRLVGTSVAAVTLRGRDELGAPCILRASKVEIPGGFHLFEIRIARRQNRCSVVLPVTAVAAWREALEACARWTPSRVKAQIEPSNIPCVPGAQYESLDGGCAFSPIRGGVRFVIGQVGHTSLTCILSKQAAGELAAFLGHVCAFNLEQSHP